ncbi:MAG: hypothetical protein IPM77_09465 [Crocinitomicaceae bacterium]|nr:hypothetical protein [Crocinitomicaceae bacterium]
MVNRILTGLLLLAVSILIPLYFEKGIEFLVANIGMGWVFSSVCLRILVILLFSVAVFQFFKLSKNWHP